MASSKNKPKKTSYASPSNREEFMAGFNQKSIFQFILFVVYAFAVFFICFFGESPAGPQILPNQIAHVRIVSEFPFTYESKIRTDRLLEKRRHMVAPVYQLDMQPYNDFESRIINFIANLDILGREIISLDEQMQHAKIEEFAIISQDKYGLLLQVEDISVLLGRLDDVTRDRIFEDGLSYVEEIMSEGVINSREVIYDNDLQLQMFFRVEIDSKQGETQIQTEEEAHFSLRRYLKFLNIDYKAFQVVFKILKTGLSVNLTYDSERTDKKIATVLSNMDPVVVNVIEGESIIEPGSVVTHEQHEELTAYRKALHKMGDYGYGFSQSSSSRFLATLAILFFSLIYMKLALVQEFLQKKRILLSALVLLLNLLLIRILLQLGNTNLFVDNPGLIAILPYLVPIALGPILITLILGVRSAMLNAFLICFFSASIQGDNINIFVLSLVATGIVVLFVSEARLRARIVRSSFMAGVVIALGVLFNGIFNEIAWVIVGQQMFVAVITGIFTGVLAVAMLPALERLFHYTTNITLFELTDFNHPLLRRLQLIAPGTYHHSLMVANLSERAAMEIDANPLICRACSLFHDIGKIEKPNYFTENQVENMNPHEEKSPSVSALVIKSHVKDGIKIAKESKLPSVIIDVIEQHHGTSLIQYFYSKALQKQKDAQEVLPLEGEEVDDGAMVEESTYRYDGPRPNFKESAIIHLADSIEAAGRSLHKVTHQSVNDLVAAIFEDRITDHQMDDCPLTLEEISKLKKSFSFTLFNMLHSRVKYPSMSDEMID